MDLDKSLEAEGEKAQNKAEKIKNLCIKQNKLFMKWNNEKDWRSFHDEHYDWWAFPINRPSSYGDKFQLGREDIQLLQKDKVFIQTLRSNSILECKSWGWDLEKGEMIKNCDPNQEWQDWPIRLKKLCQSLEIFQQKDLFFSAIKYGNILLDKGAEFSYGKHNFTNYFRNQKPVQPKVKKQEFDDIKNNEQEAPTKPNCCCESQ